MRTCREQKGPNLTTYFILAAAAMVGTSTIHRLSQSSFPVQLRVRPVTLQWLQESDQVALRLRSQDSKTRTLEPLLIYSHEFQFKLSSRTLTRSLYIIIITPYAGTTHLPTV